MVLPPAMAVSLNLVLWMCLLSLHCHFSWALPVLLHSLTEKVTGCWWRSPYFHPRIEHKRGLVMFSFSVWGFFLKRSSKFVPDGAYVTKHFWFTSVKWKELSWSISTYWFHRSIPWPRTGFCREDVIVDMEGVESLQCLETWSPHCFVEFKGGFALYSALGSAPNMTNQNLLGEWAKMGLKK